MCTFSRVYIEDRSVNLRGLLEYIKKKSNTESCS